MNDLVGTTVGPYHVTAPIGMGGTGATVYRAVHRRLSRTVALKVLPALRLAGTETVQRFRREAKVVQQLRHPNIVRVYDVGEVAGLAYIAMEYVAGGSLADLLQVGQRPDAALVSQWVIQIASALDHAHSLGIIHRDIKPGNVLLDRSDSSASAPRALLTDFGIARLSGSRMTMAGKIPGTPAYISPEQVRGGQVDRRSDVYSFAVMIYELLCGSKPFEGELYALLHKHVHEQPPPIRQFNPLLSAQTEEILAKALAKSPDQRYATAGELARDLRAALDRTGAQSALGKGDAKQTLSAGVTRRLPRVHPAVGYGAIALLLILFLLLAVLLSGPGWDSGTATPTAIVSPGKPSGTLAFMRGVDPNRDGVIDPSERTEICVLDLRDGQVRQLTQGIAHNSAPAWSPDGQRLAFFSNRQSNVDVYVMDASGGNLERLTYDPAWDSGPAWAPDSVGTPLLAFDSERTGKSEIYLLDLASRTETRLTWADKEDGDPAWSPDGRSIAFNSKRGGDLAIFVMNADGTEPRRLSRTSTSDAWPAWSPDSRNLAFARGDPQGQMDIWVMQADGSGERQIHRGQPTVCCPAWSPDGEWIAFSQRGASLVDWDLCVIRPDGSDVQCVLADGFANMHPDWRP